MTDWTGSSDQFIVDTESRYPEFSDMQTNDYSLGIVPAKPKHVKNYEDKYQYEQQHIPAYYGCRCNACPLSYMFPRGKPPMRTQTLDERQREMKRMHDAMFARARPVEIAKPSKIIEISPFVQMDGGAMLMIFLFLVIVFICCFYTKALGELKTQIKTLKQMVKKD